MIYYPISVLMLAGIRDIMIISTQEDLPNFKKLLKDGSQFGVRFTYAVQEKPEGIAQAFIIAEDFIQNDCCALILGDNIFYGQGFSGLLRKAVKNIETNGGAEVFAYQVKDPQRFGVVEFDCNNKAVSIEEKPQSPKSDYAVTGLYFYDKNASQYAKQLEKSPRGEYEITDLNNIYLHNGKLQAECFGRGFAWLDTGTHESMLRASQFVRTVEENQGIKIACLEEIAYRKGFVSAEEILNHLENIKENMYNEYVKRILK